MYHYVGLLLLENIPLKEVRKMTLEARLISNSNAFFAKQDKSPLVADEYDKQFQIALMTQKSRYRLQSGTTNSKVYKLNF